MALHRFRKGERVRAALDILYCNTGVRIAYGTEGVVEKAGLGGFLPGVKWNGRADAIATSFDSLELLDDEKAQAHG